MPPSPLLSDAASPVHPLSCFSLSRREDEQGAILLLLEETGISEVAAVALTEADFSATLGSVLARAIDGAPEPEAPLVSFVDDLPAVEDLVGAAAAAIEDSSAQNGSVPGGSEQEAEPEGSARQRNSEQGRSGGPPPLPPLPEDAPLDIDLIDRLAAELGVD